MYVVAFLLSAFSIKNASDVKFYENLKMLKIGGISDSFSETFELISSCKDKQGWIYRHILLFC